MEGTINASTVKDSGNFAQVKSPELKLPEVILKEFEKAGLRSTLVKLGINDIILKNAEVKFVWKGKDAALALSGAINLDGSDSILVDFIIASNNGQLA